ncbi:hypothetical protein [Clostridium sp.]|jgi:hypothetical protein|uniref:hypothetical protein n=1 Tax=Clostridium sp. TaxID=1506 RepID=UPI003EE95F84
MNNIDKLVKDFKYKQKKHKRNSVKGVAVFAGLGVVIVGAGMALLYQKCCSEIRHIVVSNEKNFDEDIDSDIYDNINEEIDTSRDEIKQTLKNGNNKPIGDVGSALEEAFEDLETEKQD